MLGDKIVAAIDGTLEAEWRELWGWRGDEEVKGVGEVFETEGDKSRGGRRGMSLEFEVGRGLETLSLSDYERRHG